MTAAAAVEPTELEELMKAQAEAAHERVHRAFGLRKVHVAALL